MRRPALALAAALTAFAAGALAVPTAHAITDGRPDGDDHPFVGLMVATDQAGNPLWRCSGSLVSPTLFVTAGHCTEAPAEGAELWFAEGPVTSDMGYPTSGTDAPEGEVSGTPYTHPDYDPNAFYLSDLGVVVLDDPVVLDEYAALPELDQLDGLKPSRKTTFTAVGYGLQKSFPDAAGWKEVAVKERRVAEPHLVQINTGYTGDYSIIVSANANTGGTCSGDSGGPVLVEDSNVLAGVTSFGKNPTCGGQSGIYRVDRADDLGWLAEFADQLG